MTTNTNPQGRPPRKAYSDTAAATPRQDGFQDNMLDTTPDEDRYESFDPDNFFTFESGDYDNLTMIADACRRPGYECQWHVLSVLGNTDLTRTQVGTLMKAGYRPVAGKRAEGVLFQRGENVPEFVDFGGQRLFERPQAHADYARAIAERKARGQLTDKMAQMRGEGTVLGPKSARHRSDGVTAVSVPEE